ncbi:hypothetical protein GX48_06142 [Paracoccidioides brasiliensis]|nr:hypothetical protein GX48_06142 [Paracoccidioides brasiliensis]
MYGKRNDVEMPRPAIKPSRLVSGTGNRSVVSIPEEIEPTRLNTPRADFGMWFNGLKVNMNVGRRIIPLLA